MVLPKRLVSPETQRAVAIRALEWRLRVELGQTFRFGQMIISGAQKALSDSRLYRLTEAMLLLDEGVFLVDLPRYPL